MVDGGEFVDAVGGAQFGEEIIAVDGLELFWIFDEYDLLGVLVG